MRSQSPKAYVAIGATSALSCQRIRDAEHKHQGNGGDV
jgi:hypothetical protein